MSSTVVGAVVTVFVLGGLAGLATAAGSLRHRPRSTASVLLAVTMAATALWSLGSAVQLAPVPVGVQVAARWVLLLGVHVTVAALLLFCRAVVDRTWTVRRRCLWLLPVPVLLLTALALDGEHQWFFTDRLGPRPGGGPPVLRDSFAPLFHLNALYCWALTVAGLGTVLRAWRRAPRAARPLFTASVLGAVPPAVANVLLLVWYDEMGGLDWTPLAFVLTGLLNARAVSGHGLLRVLPVAREHVLERLPDAVVVLDDGDHVVELNAAARRLVTGDHPDVDGVLLGRPAARVFAPDVLDALTTAAGDRRRVRLGGAVHVEAHAQALRDRRGTVIGRVVVLRDVTAVVAQRDALSEVNGRLAAQLRENEELRAQLHEDAVRDPLTGLHNRRVLDVSLPAALAQGRPVSVVVVDVDHFKRVNDSHGHAVGDDVLRAVAAELVAGWRAGEVVVRHGGEEFVLVLPGTGREAAVERAEQLRRRCARLGVPLDPDGGLVVRVTVSVGVATSPAGAGSAAELLALADAALYTAKRSGRDRVVAHHGHAAPAPAQLP
ncbi:histidine kinase N-terminal 7TM domain-containing diguanylate cyclase [Kineococcus sp. SYSU DK001]|uniref:histidine kinase N-terminal 7TM domain-containing diguanylate cyclase n=1 Tax=Kineococcus sp. SYSU DK001 TaxID=3383122 RepID=UPI003D7EB442